VCRAHADTIIQDVEDYLFSKPGDLQKYISNALVQCAAASTLAPDHESCNVLLGA